MQWFRNLGISGKLLCGSSVTMILMCSLGIFSLIQMGQIQSGQEELARNALPSVQNVLELYGDSLRLRLAETQHIISPSAEMMKEIEGQIDEILASFRKNQSEYEEFLSSDDEKRLYGEFKEQWARYLTAHHELIRLSHDNQDDRAKEISTGAALQSFSAASAKLQELADLNRNGAMETDLQSAAAYATSRSWVIALLIVAAVLTLIVALWLARGISRPLSQGVEVAKQLSEGVLPETLEVGSQDETGQLCAAMNGLTEYVRSMAGVAGEIANGNLTVAVNPRSDRDSFGNAFKQMVGSLS
ncbi:MAG TPA: MCP four helix bundle domain-containing protein, partial [Blastocatellia bacterium]|nr:MCP four helix bundle domain-containing protein [Blastocatellia bacterium]